MNIVDLSSYPKPEVIKALDFEARVAAIKATAIEIMPDLEAVLMGTEAEPLVAVIEACAYHMTLQDQRGNEDGTSMLIAYATGTNLTHLAVTQGIERLDGETDERLRKRLLLWMSGHTTAGSVSSYRYWGHTADVDVHDIGVTTPNPGEVQLVVLSDSGTGAPSSALVQKVLAAVNDETVRPICDSITVLGASIVTVNVAATITVRSGPDATAIAEAAEADLYAYFEEIRQVGQDATESGIHAALTQSGVKEVTLTSPSSTVAVSELQAPRLGTVNLTIEVAT